MSLDGVCIQMKPFGKNFENYTSFLRIFTTKFEFFFHEGWVNIFTEAT